MIKFLFLIVFLFPQYALSNVVIQRRSVADIERSLNIKTGPDWMCYQEFYIACVAPNPPRPGRIRFFWAPEFLIETVKAPGEYIVTDQQSERRKVELIEAARKGVRLLKGDVKLEDPSSTSSFQSMDGGNLQFSEVHVQTFKPGALLGLTCPSLTSNLASLTKRGTEERFTRWRNPKGENSITMKTWGYLNPKSGFMIHSSPMVASVATAIKGLYLLRSQPLSNLGNDKMQLVPRSLVRGKLIKPGCVSIGENLNEYEENNYSTDGRYAWLYWHRHECPCM